MKISIFGLGYVGAVSCGCLAKEGHEVYGCDVSKVKTDMINAGQTPIIEPEIGDLIKEAVKSGRLKATTMAEAAILNTEISFVSVGMPAKTNGDQDLKYVEYVCADSGKALKKKNADHVIVMRSTVLPGTTKNLVIPTLEKHSGKKMGEDFGVCFNPEFLREGTSVRDFYSPPKTVIGANDERAAAPVKALYKDLPGETVITSIEVSEFVKYADNNFHAAKVTFANEIGAICGKLGVDSHQVMEIFCKDKKLNLSPYYLTPGFAFGGSCLPKDVKAIGYKARTLDVDTPMLNSLLHSNEKQVQAVIRRIIDLGKKKVGFLGFSFKAGTDDLRGSPVVDVIEALIGKGYKVKLYDQNVNIARLMGANKSYIEEHIPHVAELMCQTMQDVITHSDLIVIGNKAEEFKGAFSLIGKEKLILDLVRVDKTRVSGGNYIGLAW